MARTDPQINLRIPAELKAKIEEIAKQSGRSATSEIIKRLESTFDTSKNIDSVLPVDKTEEEINLLNNRIARLEEHNKAVIRVMDDFFKKHLTPSGSYEPIV